MMNDCSSAVSVVAFGVTQSLVDRRIRWMGHEIVDFLTRRIHSVECQRFELPFLVWFAWTEFLLYNI